MNQTMIVLQSAGSLPWCLLFAQDLFDNKENLSGPSSSIKLQHRPTDKLHQHEARIRSWSLSGLINCGSYN